jgi:ATP-dependent DNA ligase
VDADGHAAGSSYSRADCRRHYLVKVFDVLHLNGNDLVHASVPLLERKALLETAFRPIPKFVELAESTLVDLHAQPAAILDAFGKVRAEVLELPRIASNCLESPLIAPNCP